MRRIIAFLLALLSVLAFSVCVSAGNQQVNTSVNKINGDNNFYEELMDRQRVAVEADDLIGSFLLTAGEQKLLDEYGGRYLDDTKLIICLTNVSEEACAPYDAILENYQGYYDFKKVEHSLKDLKEYKNAVVIQLEDQEIEVVEAAISHKNNNVYVGVDENDFELAAKTISAKRVSSKLPSVDIRNAESWNVSVTTLRGGTTTLHNANTNSNFSLGICGSYRGDPAILTCGHKYQQLDDTIRYNSASGAEIGTVVDHNYYSGATGDYEIVRVENPNFATSNYIASNYTVTGTVGNPSEGTVIKAYGDVSGILYGEVTYTDISIRHTSPNYTLYGMTRVEVTSGSFQNGDSGAPFFTGTANSASFAGIMSSFYVDDSTGTQHVSFTPWCNISGTGFVVKTSS